MKLIISKNRTIQELQQDFSKHYPFLKVEFCKRGNHNSFYPRSGLLEAVGLRTNGELELKNEMTVADLERTFADLFGLDIKILRRSGVIWLETTMTDNWTLEKQNDHGREISMPRNKSNDPGK